jgi:hypothetical protein
VASDTDNSCSALPTPNQKSIKYRRHNGLDLQPFGGILTIIGFRAVKNTQIIVPFAAIVCRLLGLNSAGDHGNILEHVQKYRNQDSLPVAMSSKQFAS